MLLLLLYCSLNIVKVVGHDVNEFIEQDRVLESNLRWPEKNIRLEIQTYEQERYRLGNVFVVVVVNIAIVNVFIKKLLSL